MRTVLLALTMFASICVIPGYGQQAGNSQTADQPDNAALLQKIRDLEDRLIAVEGQLRVLKSQQAPPQPAAAEAAATAQAQPQGAPPSEQAQAQLQPTASPTSALATSEAGTPAGVLGGGP